MSLSPGDRVIVKGGDFAERLAHVVSVDGTSLQARINDRLVRPEPLQYAKWITIGGEEEGDKKHVGGTPVEIDDDGTVTKGPENLTGQKVGELGRKPKLSEQPLGLTQSPQSGLTPEGEKPTIPVESGTKPQENKMNGLKEFGAAKMAGSPAPAGVLADWLEEKGDPRAKDVREGRLVLHGSGQLFLSRVAAEAVAETFKSLGGFSKIEVDERGFNSRCFSVDLWAVNAKAGNRNLFRVEHIPQDEKEYKLLKQVALGKANERDKAAFNRMRAEREVNQS